jgi:hypothetical protein
MRYTAIKLELIPSVLDPHRTDRDPDSAYHPYADPDSDFLFDADPDLTFHPDADPDPGSRS